MINKYATGRKLNVCKYMRGLKEMIIKRDYSRGRK